MNLPEEWKNHPKYKEVAEAIAELRRDRDELLDFYLSVPPDIKSYIKWMLGVVKTDQRRK